MLSLLALMCSYRLFSYLTECVQEEEKQQLVYWDSAIDMDDSNMSDTQSQDMSDRGSDSERNNLIINYLPETTTQEDLQNLFQSFGPIESCKLIKHKQLGHSLGYGFVKYQKHDDAIQAIARMNGLTLHSKTLKVSFARPANEPIRTANLYVSGLKNTITEEELVTTFNKYGKVLSVKVMHNDNDPVKVSAIGFVRFEQFADAQKAVEGLNGTGPFSNPGPLHVSFAKQSKDSLPPAAMMPQAGYANFPPGRLPNYGKTPTIIPGRNMRFDPLSRGGLPRHMDIGYSPDGFPPDPNNGYVLFVFNLSPEVEELHLWRLFGPYGAIRSVNVVMDKGTNKSKGYAFVNMTNYAEAENAIISLNQSMVEGKLIHVSFKKPGSGKH